MSVEQVLETLPKIKRLQSPVDAETRLFKGGLDLDSIEFLELVMALEKACGVDIRSEHLTDADVVSVGSLGQHVSTLPVRR